MKYRALYRLLSFYLFYKVLTNNKKYSLSHGSKVAFASAVKLDLSRKASILPLYIK